MRWNEVVKKIKKIGYKKGVRTRHKTIWNCPCPIEEGTHPVGVGNQPSKECHFEGLKSQLGPHKNEFGKT